MKLVFDTEGARRFKFLNHVIKVCQNLIKLVVNSNIFLKMYLQDYVIHLVRKFFIKLYPVDTVSESHSFSCIVTVKIASPIKNEKCSPPSPSILMLKNGTEEMTRNRRKLWNNIYSLESK